MATNAEKDTPGRTRTTLSAFWDKILMGAVVTFFGYLLISGQQSLREEHRYLEEIIDRTNASTLAELRGEIRLLETRMNTMFEHLIRFHETELERTRSRGNGPGSNPQPRQPLLQSAAISDSLRARLDTLAARLPSTSLSRTQVLGRVMQWIGPAEAAALAERLNLPDAWTLLLYLSDYLLERHKALAARNPAPVPPDATSGPQTRAHRRPR